MWLKQNEQWEEIEGKVRETVGGDDVGPQSPLQTLTFTWHKMESLEGFEQRSDMI